MKARRPLGTLMIAAGLGLCAAAALHYWRGAVAQREGRVALDSLLTRANAAPIPHEPAENPGIIATPVPAPEAYPYGRPLARLRIPAAEIDVVVFAGSDPETLEKGPGHVPGTALPGVEGLPNNCVIAGHRDSHFRHLGWLKPGHEIFLETPSKQMSYRIVLRKIVRPDAVSVLAATPTPRLTLITCYPFNFIGPAPDRLVLVAEPLDPRRTRHSS